MQVHYNLLAGTEPDVTAAQLRLAPGDTPTSRRCETMLLPAPVELPCRPGHDTARCATATAAVADVTKRFGRLGQHRQLPAPALRRASPAGPVQTCDREIQRAGDDPRRRPATCTCSAARSRSRSTPARPRRETRARHPGLGLRQPGRQAGRAQSSCSPATRSGSPARHDQSLRDMLPAFEGQQERYVVWGEGTTDEMCLGMLLVTRP